MFTGEPIVVPLFAAVLVLTCACKLPPAEGTVQVAVNPLVDGLLEVHSELPNTKMAVVGRLVPVTLKVAVEFGVTVPTGVTVVTAGVAGEPPPPVPVAVKLIGEPIGVPPLAVVLV
jgi:hypothetical protein